MKTYGRQRANEAILERFSSLPGSPELRIAPPGYTLTPGDNLLSGIPPTILEDFASGSGGELDGDAPKFCAVHSSSALAANSFGLMWLHPDRFTLAGLGGFTEARFEEKLPTGLGGTPPNLDFFASGPGGTVAVESKFTEIMQPKTAEFRAPYEAAVAELAEPCWEAVYRSLLDNANRFNRLDAAQLVKHYLGMRRSLSGVPGKKALLYVYWEPSNSTEIPEFSDHRLEVKAFSSEVTDSEIHFVAMSHAAVWNLWESSGGDPQLAVHLQALRARYELAL